MNQQNSPMAGVCTPICTIFDKDGGRIDESGQKNHLDNLLEAGVDIICVCGGTGEFSFLTRPERLRLTELVAEHLAGRARLIVHVSAVMTEETIEYAKHAEGSGADCLLVLPPYFEGPTLEGTFRALRESGRLRRYGDHGLQYSRPFGDRPGAGFRLPAHADTEYPLSQGQYGGFPAHPAAGPRRGPGVQRRRPAHAAQPHGRCGRMLLGNLERHSGPGSQALRVVRSRKVGGSHLRLWQTLFPVNDFVWRSPFNPSVKALGNLLGRDLGACRRPAQPLTDDQYAELRNAAACL